MNYVAFYNPESKKIEVDTLRNYHEIKFYSNQRGFDGFKVIQSKFCITKKAANKFEKEIKCSLRLTMSS